MTLADDLKAARGLTARDRALALAVSIINARAAEIEGTYVKWREKYPEDTVGAATERAAFHECHLLSRLVSEKMSPAGRRAIAAAQAKDTPNG